MAKSKSENRNLLLFFAIAIGFTWLFWVPQALATQGIIAPSWFTNLKIAAWGPLVAAFLMTFINEGGKGVLNLLKRAVDLRFNKLWLIPVFLLLPVIIGGSLLIAIISGEPSPEIFWLDEPLSLAIVFFGILILGGPLQEEFGWRGYALPRLQLRFNALVSGLIMGAIWFIWHLPLFFISGEAYYQSPMLAVLPAMVLLTILFTWIFNNTGGSIFAALIFHTTYNWSHTIFPALETVNGGLFFIIFLLIAVVVVLIVWRPSNLVRKRDRVTILT
jgi:membrane protease YdiL (CAAX protease family)